MPLLQEWEAARVQSEMLHVVWPRGSADANM